MDGNNLINLSKLAMDPKGKYSSHNSRFANNSIFFTGSHILGSFYKRGTIGEKNKDKMLTKLKVINIEFSNQGES